MHFAYSLCVQAPYTVGNFLLEILVLVCIQCVQERDGNTALHVAVAAHRIEAIKILLEATTSSMSVPNHSQITPIIAAAITGFYLYVVYIHITLYSRTCREWKNRS